MTANGCRTARRSNVMRVSVFLLTALTGPSLARGATVVRTISGSRLTIAIGDDTSLQVWDGTVGPGFALLAPNCADSSQTGDAGILVAIGGNTFGPDFASHPCGTNTPAALATPWTPVSISPVTGSGSASDPFTVVVVADAGTTGLRLTETVRHVDGTGSFVPTLTFSSSASVPLTWRTFLATHLSLGNDTVLPILQLGAPGAQSAFPLGAPFPACAPRPYYALVPSADRFTGQLADVMWIEIAAGQLSDTLEPGCPHGGIATEWTDRTLSPGGAALTLASTSPAVAFVDGPPASCAADSHTLCLNQSRFAVTASFTDVPQGLPVQATAVPLTGDTGYFWFFDPANVELVVKVLDGCAVNGNFWAFAGGLTNVNVLLQVTDTRTGATKPYSNALGSAFQPVQDSSAFPCP